VERFSVRIHAHNTVISGSFSYREQRSVAGALPGPASATFGDGGLGRGAAAGARDAGLHDWRRRPATPCCSVRRGGPAPKAAVVAEAGGRRACKPEWLGCKLASFASSLPRSPRPLPSLERHVGPHLQGDAWRRARLMLTRLNADAAACISSVRTFWTGIRLRACFRRDELCFHPRAAADSDIGRQVSKLHVSGP
jgi:hypothetical protein